MSQNKNDYAQRSIAARKNGSPLHICSDISLQNRDDLSVHYSPGIAGPCQAIAKDVTLGKKITSKRNTVAVISDGSAVLGLGNIGALAALPVMEGKCLLLNSLAKIDGIPIVLDTQDSAEIISTITALAPTFGGINLEDIAAPRCFEISQALVKKLDIPVFHDDQDGTAIVTLAALINALRITEQDKTKIKIIISGAGAAGIAIARLLKIWGAANIIIIDSQGVVTCDRAGINDSKKEFCVTNAGQLQDAVRGGHVFIGVSKAGLLTAEMVSTMAPDPIIFAMANPIPEIMPDVAKASGAAIVATGRSDFDNQINNVLIFPGLFRGLLDGEIVKITPDIKLRAAYALAELVSKPDASSIIPDPFDPRVVPTISQAVQQKD